MMIPPVPHDHHSLAAMIRARAGTVPFNTQAYFRAAMAFVRHNLCWFVMTQLMWIGILVLSSIALKGLFVAMRLEYWNGAVRGTKTRWIIASLIHQWIFEVLVVAPMIAGYFMTIFNALRTNTFPNTKPLFSAYRCPLWCRITGLATISFILSRLGLVLFIAPGVWFMIASMYSYPLLLEFNYLRPWKAIKLSIRAVHSQCCAVLGLLVCIVLVQLLGALCLGVGLLFTTPVCFLAFCYAYHAQIGINGMPVALVGLPVAAPVSPAAAGAVSLLAAAHPQPSAAAAPVSINVQVQHSQQPAPPVATVPVQQYQPAPHYTVAQYPAFTPTQYVPLDAQAI